MRFTCAVHLRNEGHKSGVATLGRGFNAVPVVQPSNAFAFGGARCRAKILLNGFKRPHLVKPEHSRVIAQAQVRCTLQQQLSGKVPSDGPMVCVISGPNVELAMQHLRLS